MPRFEVFCPASPPALPEDVTLRLDAEHWLAALKAGLGKTGGTQPATNVLCDVQADGSIHVTDPRGGGVFRIRELRDAAPSAPAPLVASPPRPAPRAEDVLAELFDVVGQVAALDRRAGLERLLELALEKVDAEAGSVLLARAGGKELEFVVVRGPRAKELAALGVAVPVGVGIVGYCVREDVALAVSDVQHDRRFHGAIAQAIGYETRSILCAPIARKGQVLGALEVLNKRGGAPFGAHDLAVLSYLAHHAAEHLGRTAP
jgi:hypothetical protein